MNANEIAERNTIFYCEVGSGAHGINEPGTDDTDIMGACIEPPAYVIGMQKFEQWEHHTAWEREGGRANKSGPGDVDYVFYSLRKFVRLAVKGNPSILVPLFVPDEEFRFASSEALELRRCRDLIISKQAGYRFLGYLRAQKSKLIGEKTPKTKRPELIEKYGYDTKFAGHAVRLGLQGLELMRKGKITLPMSQHAAWYIKDLRKGKFRFENVIDYINIIERQLVSAIETTDLPEHPNYEWADKYLIWAYNEYWRRAGYLNDGRGAWRIKDYEEHHPEWKACKI